MNKPPKDPGPPVAVPDRSAAEKVLRRVWRYEAFREGQWETIDAVLHGRDALVVLPTGGGKSLLYQVPPILTGGMTLVISPLIALMQDQVRALRARGISAAFINSTLTPREAEQTLTDAEFGRYRLLYVAPERLETPLFQARAERLRPSLLAVDEAHCISEWGHDFRPSYLKIGEARSRLGSPPILAVTATATPEVRQDVREHLGLNAPLELVTGFDRPNIIWTVFKDENKQERLFSVARGVGGTGIVYASTRRGAEQWAARLTRAGIETAPYHAGLPATERERVQARWMQGDLQAVAATSAFGMGIDKADVRWVVHVDLPPSLEAYYQEAGRAGRDGRRAHAVLLYDRDDEATQRHLLEEGHPSAAEVRAVYDAAAGLARVPYATLPDHPMSISIEAVAVHLGFSLGKVRAALDVLLRQGVWTEAFLKSSHVLLRFQLAAEAVRAYADQTGNESIAAFTRSLLRSVNAEAFKEWWPVDLKRIARRSGISDERVTGGLAHLRERGVLDWMPPDAGLRVTFAEARQTRLLVDERLVRAAQRRAEVRIDRMVRYARSVACRRHFLLAYFGEASPRRCGACDLCLGRHEPVVVTPADEPALRKLLEQAASGRPRAEWQLDGGDPDRMDALADWLVQEEYLRVAYPALDQYAPTAKATAFIRQWKPRRAE